MSADRTSLTVAFVFVVAFWVHVINDNIPDSMELWPAPPSTVHKMDAIVYRAHGSATDVLQYETNHPRPLIHSSQVLIEVAYSSINPVDYKVRRNWVPNFFIPKPKIPGEDVSGEIVEVGTAVPPSLNLQVGDRVAAMMPLMGSQWGGLAGYAAVDASFVAKLGDNTSFEQAAAVPLVGLTAVQALEKLDDENVEKILIHAGAGGLGSFAIQYARHVMKIPLVATTASSGNSELVKSLGANVVIDYRKQNFESVVENYDAVLDPMSWMYESRTIGTEVLKPTGHYLNIASSDFGFDGTERTNILLTAKNLVYCTIVNLFRSGKVPNYSFITVVPNGRQLQTILDLVDEGVVRPVIDRTFPLSDAADAFLYLEKGHAAGKVLLEHAKK